MVNVSIKKANFFAIYKFAQIKSNINSFESHDCIFKEGNGLKGLGIFIMCNITD